MGRHISIKIQREVEWKFRLHCGFPGCKKPAMDLHHTKRFSITKRHSADEIVPLCKIHHELAHDGAIGNEELLPKYGNRRGQAWRLNLEGDEDNERAMVDEKVQKKKMEWRGIRSKTRNLKNRPRG